ncbi:MAG: hypothetical protein QM831_32820 [Kofleriaceae bacterium]
MRSLIFATLVACGGGSSGEVHDVAQPAADPAPCADASANAVKFLGKDEAPYADKIAGVMKKRCDEDKWSVDLRKCLLTAKSEQDLDPCEKFFAGSQMQLFKADLEKIDPGNQQGTAPPPPPPSSAAPPPVPPAANTMPTGSK